MVCWMRMVDILLGDWVGVNVKKKLKWAGIETKGGETSNF